MAELPPLVYGTAWKEERTEPLVRAALRAGFRGIDTANQRKHYHEAAVGAALKEAFASGLVARDDVFVQTKFTYVRGQDHRLPYDPRDPIAKQVASSFASSLDHLGVDRLDSYLLHGPSTYPGLGEADHEAWRAMEDIQREGRVARIGISNVAIDQLEALHAVVRVKPTVVQNRTFTRPHADRAVRAFCRDKAIAYQGFSLLTAIPPALAHPIVQGIALRLDRTPAEAIFAWCLARGIVVLTGTSSQEHMKHDLATPRLALLPAELEALDRLLGA